MFFLIGFFAIPFNNAKALTAQIINKGDTSEMSYHDTTYWNALQDYDDFAVDTYSSTELNVYSPLKAGTVITFTFPIDTSFMENQIFGTSIDQTYIVNNSLAAATIYYIADYALFTFSEELYWFYENANDDYYDDGYNDGIIAADSESYHYGYIQGEIAGIASVDAVVDIDLDGYDDDSYEQGELDAWDSAYYQGYTDVFSNGFAFVGLDPELSHDWSNYYASHASDYTLAITSFIPGILGSIFVFFFQMASIEFLGISALEVIAMFAVVAVAILVFKLFFSK